MYFCPLSPTLAAFPHVFLSSGIPCIPNPILESQVTQSFWPFPRIPILALTLVVVSGRSQAALKPSLLQLVCKEA